jgi:hypothetical protein
MSVCKAEDSGVRGAWNFAFLRGLSSHWKLSMIRVGSKIVVSVSVLLFAASIAHANGVVTQRKAGGLVFTKTDTISIASEDLYISRDEIRVSYVYQSKAPRTQNVTISFPMPEVPIDDGPDTEDAFMNDKIPDARNYMNFKVSVDGKPVESRMVERALFNGKDITERLKKAGIPLLLVKDRQEALAKVSKGIKDQLVKEELLSFSESNGFYMTNWSYQVLFEWEQAFKPGPSKVDVSYRPITGDGADCGEYLDTGEGVKKYGPEPAFRAALKKRRTALEPTWIGYVVKTAKYWNGPIGKFRLVVDKGRRNNLVAFCPANSKKISDTQFEWTATNFVPQKDLDVVIFSVVSEEQ